MKVNWGLALVAIASTIVIVRPDAVDAFYQELYPSDPEKRRALNECFTLDPRFDRLDAAGRGDGRGGFLRTLAWAGMDRGKVFAPHAFGKLQCLRTPSGARDRSFTSYRFVVAIDPFSSVVAQCR